MTNVKIYIYDLSKGLAKTISYQLIGKKLDGIWHSGVVVYGREFFYGSDGIDECAPGGTILGDPTFIEDLGRTELPEELFRSYLYELSEKQFRGDKYHLFDHNCNNFSDTVTYFLTSRHIPDYVTSLPTEVAGTPLGNVIRSFVDQMQISKSHPVNSAVPSPSTSKQNKNNSAVSSLPSQYKRLDTTKDFISCEDRFPAEVAQFSYEENKCTNLEATMRDIFEFATSTQSLTWSLGPGHFQLLAEVKGSASPVELQILELFRFALTRGTDVAIGFARDRGRHFRKFLDTVNNASEAPPAFHQGTLKMIANWIVKITEAEQVDRCPDELKVIAEYCVTVLAGPPEQRRWAAAVALNLTVLQLLTEDEALGLASILIHVLTLKDPADEETTRQHAKKAVLRLIETSEEIRDLANVQGLDEADLGGGGAPVAAASLTGDTNIA